MNTRAVSESFRSLSQSLGSAVGSVPTRPWLRRWWLVVALGFAVGAVGIVLIANLSLVLRTLVVLIAVGLVATGFDELAQAGRHRTRWPSYVLGGICFVTAAIVLFWPDVTLWIIGVVVGFGWFIGGGATIYFAASYRREVPLWGVWILDGAASALVGAVALAWPDRTIVALALLLGVRVAFRGLSTVTFGLGMRHLLHRPAPEEPLQPVAPC